MGICGPDIYGYLRTRYLLMGFYGPGIYGPGIHGPGTKVSRYLVIQESLKLYSNLLGVAKAVARLFIAIPVLSYFSNYVLTVLPTFLR